MDRGRIGPNRVEERGEILGQVATVMEEHPVKDTHPHRREEDPFPWNIVMMGMGEPLENEAAVYQAARVMTQAHGLQIGARPAPGSIRRRRPSRCGWRWGR